MIQQRGTVKYGPMGLAREIIDRRGLKALWVSHDLIASGDQEDLPLTVIPWTEVSEYEAWKRAENPPAPLDLG